MIPLVHSSGRISRWFVLAIIVLIASGCSGVRGDFADPALSVSMRKLLGNERIYEGKRVHVAGYLGVDMNLYLSEEHAKAFDLESSIPISDSDDGGIEASSCRQSFVFLEGRLEETDSNLFTLVDISRVVRSGRDAHACWSRR